MNITKCLICFCILLTACTRKNFELEQIAEDVIKSKEGIEIDVKPIPKS